MRGKLENQTICAAALLRPTLTAPGMIEFHKSVWSSRGGDAANRVSTVDVHELSLQITGLEELRA
jgi:hypothetical protein